MNATKCVSIAICLALGACAEDDAVDAEERGGLMFGLESADVEQIHADYLEDEDIDVTTARLTAPFDCSLYGELCELVGPEGAETLTGEIVDMALEGAPTEEIDEFIDARVDELSHDYDASDELNHPRGAGPWRYSSSVGNPARRVRIRSGIYTPAVGQRRAWTRIHAQVRTSAGLWGPGTADTLCVSAGTNTQTRSDDFGGTIPVETQIESFVSPVFCQDDVNTMFASSLHARNTGGFYPPAPPLPAFTRSYEISSQGSGSATFGGQTVSIASAGRVEQF